MISGIVEKSVTKELRNYDCLDTNALMIWRSGTWNSENRVGSLHSLVHMPVGYQYSTVCELILGTFTEAENRATRAGMKLTISV